jgi:hypothetical protein
MLVRSKLPPIGCNGRGVQDSSPEHPVSYQEPSLREQFRLVKQAGVFDFLDRLPGAADLVDCLGYIEEFELPVQTTSWFYGLGRDEMLIQQNMVRAAAVSAKMHNFMLYPNHADGHELTDLEIADTYLKAYDDGTRIGVEPTFELHVNTWTEDPRRITPVAQRVEARGVSFNLTLDYSHMIFKIGNQPELRFSKILKAVEEGSIVLDPFAPNNLVDEWLSMGIVRWLQVRAAAPNGPRNIWAPHDPAQPIAAIPNPPVFPMQPGEPGRGILYPFAEPAPGEWHSPWSSDALAMTREVIRKVLTHHMENADSRLGFITTEMITLPDYALNAKFSLIGQNAAIARYIRATWDQIAAAADGSAKPCKQLSAIRRWGVDLGETLTDRDQPSNTSSLYVSRFISIISTLTNIRVERVDEERRQFGWQDLF